ncbi:Fe-S protein assembly co-chaperone HscB [Buchnera aphidicola]|uniref:Fe-S protein assembly co-chaperone HscB n=1 Tax=Buchnera aphidicola TaxID=9 RepID=UPI003BEF02CA
MDYFTLFNLPKKIKINKKLLSENFYKLQLTYHPDLFINASSLQKKNILQKSIAINKGYKTLKNFLDRAMYLLLLNNININKKKILSNDNIFLSKYFSLYEELDYVQKNKNDQIAFSKLEEKIKNIIKKYKYSIVIELDEKNWTNAEKIILELLFFLKIEKNLKK